ncbi:MAG TPA: ABC transporter ATP-binding protein [Vicinamibacterales bacterium]|nr:ABC transporter ATP-binding protein [Vicinamibacterales bacterium]
MKSFGGTRAVDGLSLEVAPGEMFGLIGPDGAGKTTTLRMMCGLLRPDSGEVRLFDADPFKVRRISVDSVGYVSQRFSLYGDLTIDENIAFFARLHGVSHFADKRTRLLTLTGLLPFRDRLASKLSGGMKQKLALACTLVHEPALLILDEPTTGVDPVSRREFWKLLNEFRANGLTAVLATPYLDEAERCGRVALLRDGKVLALDTPDALRRMDHTVMLEVIASPSRQALRILREKLGDDEVSLFGDRLHARVPSEAMGTQIAQWLSDAQVDVTRVKAIVPTLEDVFIEHVRQGARS